jgi:hypothetical protein
MEHRNQTRIYLQIPIVAKTRIYRYKDKKVSDHYTLVSVDNISSTGLGFTSSLDFPVSDELVLFIDLPFLSSRTPIFGTLVWKKREKEQYIYGVEIKSTNIGYIQSIAHLSKPYMLMIVSSTK